MKSTISTFLLFAFIATITQSCKEEKDSDAIILVHSRGGRCLKGKGGCAVAIYSKDDSHALSESNMGISMRKVSGSTLQIDFTQSFDSEDGDNFYVDSELIIPQSASKDLGQKNIKIQPGEYKIDKTKNKLGTVIVKATFD